MGGTGKGVNGDRHIWELSKRGVVGEGRGMDKDRGFVLEIVDMVSGEMVSMLMAVVIGVVGKLVVVRR